MKKKLLAAVASVCLVAALGVGATLAYYTSVTEEKVNTFTIGNVDITLTEPEWDPENGKDLVPGAEVPKNPLITNTGASDGYMMLEVTGMDAMAQLGFSAMNGDVAGYNTADWVLVDKNGAVRTDNPENKLVDGYYVYIGKTDADAVAGTVAAGKSTSALFTSVKLSEDAEETTATEYKVIANFVDADGNLFTYKDVNGNVIEANANKVPEVDSAEAPIIKYTINGVDNKVFDTYADAENYVLENYSEKVSFVFDLTVQGYAIQAEEVTFVNDAKAYEWVKQFTGNAN